MPSMNSSRKSANLQIECQIVTLLDFIPLS